MKKLNCWEYKKCNCEEKCLVTKDVSFNGINDGINAGRCCWIVRNILEDEFTGSCIKNVPSCSECDFYKNVHSEENLLL